MPQAYRNRKHQGVQTGLCNKAEMIDKRIKTIQGVQKIDVQEPVSYAKHRYDLVYTT